MLNAIIKITAPENETLDDDNTLFIIIQPRKPI